MRVDAREETYEIVELFDRPMLFTNLRVDLDTVPKGYFRYEVREDDYGNGDPCQIARSIMVNHWGTLITNKPIDLDGDGYLDIDPEEDWNYTGETMTLDDYMKAYPVKKEKSKER